ncbi:SagB family peptide dehydrogenase [Streptomyces afghaniensis]|uniref:SagB/ThcOx family dehydrogenase n=1 Tax=Streptomyces afghaniensis TaxID=66865 RepID=UPI0033A3C7BC
MTSFTVSPVRGGIREALGRLAEGPAPLPEVLEGLRPAERVQFQRFLRRAGHLTVRHIQVGGSPLMSIEQTARYADYEPAEVLADTWVRLSSFAFCRSRDNAWVLESPLAKHRALLGHVAGRGLVAELGAPQRVRDLTVRGLSQTEAAVLIAHLAGAGFVELGTAQGRFASDEDPTQRQWEFHDLLFHSRIRAGRYDGPYGRAYSFLGEIDPQPAVKPLPNGPCVDLHRPSLDDVMTNDQLLTTALEGRRSIRTYGEQPMTARQLGEFLYRVARIRARSTPEETLSDEMLSRPYPSGGSLHELELYLSIGRCEGLDQGIYYYDAVGHRLVLVSDNVTDREAMFGVAAISLGLEVRPDVVITLTSRFQRMAWKYRAIAYATTLRHTGVLYQTMYLVATVMGLAPCGLGAGNADLSAQVLGLDPLVESSVGDFVLGSRPTAHGDSARPEAGWQPVNSPDWEEATYSLLP